MPLKTLVNPAPQPQLEQIYCEETDPYISIYLSIGITSVSLLWWQTSGTVCYDILVVIAGLEKCPCWKMPLFDHVVHRYLIWCETCHYGSLSKVCWGWCIMASSIIICIILFILLYCPLTVFIIIMYITIIISWRHTCVRRCFLSFSMLR